MASTRMQPRDLVLLVIAECGSNEQFGRTSMQKITYLTSLVLGIDLGHRAYYYGPYSAAVEADAEALTLSGMVAETVTPLGTGARGFPVNHYHYKVTETGQGRLRRLSEAYPTETLRAREFVNEIRNVVGSFRQDVLSAAAKTLYIAREQGEPVTVEQVQTLAKDFGWDLPPQRIEHVVKLLADLNLVTTS